MKDVGEEKRTTEKSTREIINKKEEYGQGETSKNRKGKEKKRKERTEEKGERPD
jgi:hypothetical protein